MTTDTVKQNVTLMFANEDQRDAFFALLESGKLGNYMMMRASDANLSKPDVLNIYGEIEYKLVDELEVTVFKAV